MYCSTGTVPVIGPTGATLLPFYTNTIIPELKSSHQPLGI